MAKKKQLTFEEHLAELHVKQASYLAETLKNHGMLSQDISVYQALESLSDHAPRCTCPTGIKPKHLLPFSGSQGDHISFKFDGESAFLTLDKTFQMPNPESLAVALLEVDFQDSYFETGISSGDEFSAGMTLANKYVDELQIGGVYWAYSHIYLFGQHDDLFPENCGMPWERDEIEGHAFAGASYRIIGGSGSPGADDSGWHALCEFNSFILRYASDPGEWSFQGRISKKEAIAELIEDFSGNDPDNFEEDYWIHESLRIEFERR